MLQYQHFLATELATASKNPTELKLLVVHYHQALLKAILTFQPCTDCSGVDLDTLKERIESVRNESFSTFQELMKAFASSLQGQGLSNLCKQCRERIPPNTLQHFYQIRTHQLQPVIDPQE